MTREDEEPYHRVHQACQPLLHPGGNLKDKLKLVSNVVSSLSDSQLEEVHISITYPIRLLLRNKSTSQTNQVLLVDALKGILVRTKLSQFSTLKDLLNQLFVLISDPLEAKKLKGTEELKNAVLECVKVCLQRLDESIWPEFYSENYLPEFGHKVYVLVEVCRSQKAASLKLLAFDCLLLMTDGNGPDKIDCIGSVLPGILIACVEVPTSNGTLHHEVILKCLELFTKMLTLVLNDCADNHTQRNTQALLITRNEQWLSNTCEKVSKLISKLCRQLVAHENFQVRLSLLHLTEKVLFECNSTLKSCKNTMIDVLVLLLHDSFPQVQFLANGILFRLKSSEQWIVVFGRLEETLYDLCTKLPMTVRNESEEMGEIGLKQVCGILNSLGKEGVKKLCLSSNHLRRLSLALCQITEFDVKRLDYGSTATVTEVQETSEKDCWPDLPLKFIKDRTVLGEILNILGDLGDIQILIDHLLDLFQESTIYQCQSCFLLNYLLQSVNGSFDYTILESAIQLFSERLTSLELDLAPNDEQVTDLILDHSKDTVLSCVLMQTMAQIGRIMGKDGQKHLLEVLYPIIYRTTSGQMIVRDSSLCALRILAFASGHSTISDLLVNNADYLVYNLEIKLKHFLLNPRSPLVLSALLDLCSDCKMYDYVKHMVKELLYTLDLYHAEQCLLFMKSLLSFVRALPRWFPDASEAISEPPPLETEESEEGTQPTAPEHITLTVEILKRTKHLIGTDHFPLRLAVMDMIKLGLEAISLCENELLPMVHQNWAGILLRFDDKEKIVALKSFEVICVMARLSNTFVYRRIMDQLWPRIETFMSLQAKHSCKTGSIYRQTAGYKLQEAILRDLAQLFQWIKALDCDIIRAIDLFNVYLKSDQARSLQILAQEAIEQLERLRNDKL